MADTITTLDDPQWARWKHKSVVDLMYNEEALAVRSLRAALTRLQEAERIIREITKPIAKFTNAIECSKFLIPQVVVEDARSWLGEENAES